MNSLLTRENFYIFSLMLLFIVTGLAVGGKDLPAFPTGLTDTSAAAPAYTVGDKAYLTGWAWGATTQSGGTAPNGIGWISFDCSSANACVGAGGVNTSYKVYAGATDAATGRQPIKGYAWSSALGWLSFECDKVGATKTCFNTSYTADDYPTDANAVKASAYIDTTATNVSVLWDGSGSKSGKPIKGWARFCSVFDTACTGRYKGTPAVGSPVSDSSTLGGWDGWVNFSGKSDDGNSYGVVVDTTGNLYGFAWAGPTVGWISFRGGVTAGGEYGVATVPLTVSCASSPEGKVNTATDVTWTATPSSNVETFLYAWEEKLGASGSWGPAVPACSTASCVKAYNTEGQKVYRAVAIQGNDTGMIVPKTECSTNPLTVSNLTPTISVSLSLADSSKMAQYVGYGSTTDAALTNFIRVTVTPAGNSDTDSKTVSGTYTLAFAYKEKNATGPFTDLGTYSSGASSKQGNVFVDNPTAANLTSPVNSVIIHDNTATVNSLVIYAPQSSPFEQGKTYTIRVTLTGPETRIATIDFTPKSTSEGWIEG